MIFNKCVAAAAVMVFVMAGCATNPPKMSEDLQKEYDAPLYCQGAKPCSEMWERAIFFVKNNAGYKLQILNDSVIETYNPRQHATDLAFSITKEPLGNGKYQIWTKAWCNNMFGCQPNQHEAIARAKRYMRTGIK